jgi:hypothetical protein
MSEQIIPYNSWMLGGIGGRDVGSDMFKWVANARMMEERERTRKDGCVLGPRQRGGGLTSICADAGMRPL